MAIIKLTKGYETIVDDDVAEVMESLGWIWCAKVDPRTVYAVSRLRYPGCWWVTLPLHRWVVGAPPGVDVDHRNGNGLDNQRGNLRLANESQNQGNSVSTWSATGYRGVYALRSGRFRTVITFQGKRLPIGTFDRALDASRAYEATRAELFGEFAPIGR